MEEIVLEGRLSCAARQWPVQVRFSPVITTRLRYDNTWPSPCDPNDIVYQGNATVISGEPGQALPSESDLHGNAVFLLLDTLPHHGPCPSGQWRLPIHVTKVDPPAGHESVRFEFIQHGVIGPPLK
jgi:hypothetical protein